jgi:mono/diheme cytochrome c family protein
MRGLRTFIGRHVMRFLHSTLAKIVATAVGLLVLIGGGALAFVRSGIYDVSASSKDNPYLAATLHATYEASLHRHGGRDIAPGDLLSLENVRAGARMYDANCATCHGAPDSPLSAVGQGIQPAAPSLLAAQRRNKPELMFWVIKHGVNMTAMPSFGKTQSDQTLWQVAAFIYAERGVSKEQYDGMVQGVPGTAAPSARIASGAHAQ